MHGIMTGLNAQPHVIAMTSTNDQATNNLNPNYSENGIIHQLDVQTKPANEYNLRLEGVMRWPDGSVGNKAQHETDSLNPQTRERELIQVVL